jgi:hypothetical protein
MKIVTIGDMKNKMNNILVGIFLSSSWHYRISFASSINGELAATY